MEKTDRERFIVALLALAEVFSKKIGEVAAEVYFAALDDLPLERVLKALSIAARSERFMPPPSVIRDLTGAATGIGDPKDRSLRAWTELRRAVDEVGPYRDLVLDDPAAGAAVHDMGGWEEFCYFGEEELPYRQKDFERLYAMHARMGVQGPLELPGIHTKGNLKNGHGEYKSAIGFLTMGARGKDGRAQISATYAHPEPRKALPAPADAEPASEPAMKMLPPPMTDEEFERRRIELVEKLRERGIEIPGADAP